MKIINIGVLAHVDAEKLPNKKAYYITVERLQN